MHNSLHLLPVPGFLITPDYQVLVASPAAQALFGEVTVLLSIVDSASRSKCLDLIGPHSSLGQTELNFITHRDELILCEVYQMWSEEDACGQLLCIPKDAKLEGITQQMQQLRHQAAQPFKGVTFPRPTQLPEVPEQTPTVQALRQIRLHISTLRDILSILQPALVEINRSAYAQLLTDEVQSAEQFLLDLIRNTQQKGTS